MMRYAKLQEIIFLNVFVIIIARNIGKATEQNFEDDTFNLSCIPEEIKGIFQEVWTNSIQANNLSSLIELKISKENPHWTGIISSFNGSLRQPLRGQRLRAYLTVPKSGLYDFHVSCRNACAIQIQVGNIFIRCQKITTSINMTAGKFYHMTVLHVGGTSRQRLRIAVTTPNGSKEVPIPPEYLVAYKADGILGEFTPGAWASWSSCHSHPARETRRRHCQRFPPLYSQLNSAYEVNESRNCIVQGADNDTCNNTALGFENTLFPDYNITASSSFLDKYPHKARLAGEEAWCPQTNSSQEYLDVTLGSLHSICAIATQGLHEIGAFTTTYRLQLSTDGKTWEWYNDGSSEIIQGNVNSYGVVKNVFKSTLRAQHVRIWPVSFCVHPCLRIEIFGKLEERGPPAYPPTNVSVQIMSMRLAVVTWHLPDYFASRYGPYEMKLSLSMQGIILSYTRFNSSTSRFIRELKLNTTYCVSVLAFNDIGNGPWSDCVNFTTPSVCPPGWISFRSHCYRAFRENILWTDANVHCLNSNSELTSIHSQPENQLVISLVSAGSGCTWIGLRYHGIGANWTDGSLVNFTGWSESYSPSAHPNIACVAFSENSSSWIETPCLSNCQFICKRKDYERQDCSDLALGMENKAIPDTSFYFTSASAPSDPSSSDPRLGSSGGWCPIFIGDDVYFKINLMIPHLICAIGTQGHSEIERYVTAYKIELAIGYSKGEYYMEGGTIKIFEANNNRYGIKKNTLQSGVVAKYVTLWPTKWHDQLCFRMEIYGRAHLERVPTRAPENVTYSFSSVGLEVTWSPLPVYFHGHTLTGYMIEVIKPGGISMGAWAQSVAPPLTAQIFGITSGEVDCVLVYGFTIYGTGVSNSCQGAAQQWSQWTEWSTCSKTCGHGQQFRNRTCLSQMQCNGSRDEWQHCNLLDCKVSFVPELKPPSNLTARNSSSSSFVIQWSPYSGNATLLGYRVLVLNQGGREHRAKRSLTSVEAGQLVKNFTVGANVTMIEIGNLSPLTKYCVQIGLITEEGDGNLSRCFYFQTGRTAIVLPPPEASAYRDESLLVTVQWEPLDGLPKGLLLGYFVFFRDINTTVIAGPCKTNASAISAGCIEVAAFTSEGLGNTTACLSILKPLEETTPKISASIKKTLSTIHIKWDPDTFKSSNGDILGYELLYKLVRVNGELTLHSEHKKIIICSSSKDFLLTNLSVFSGYNFQMAAITANGVGKYSDPVYGETCACPENIKVASSSQNVNSGDDNFDTVATGLQNVISTLVIDTCGYCEHHGKTNLVFSNDSNSDELIFPVTKTSYGQSAYSKFIPVIRIPGVVVITRKKELGTILTQAASGSILDSWPIIVITITMALLAGIIIWFLDSNENPEHFPRHFIKGAGQGFWWSFISMTTVGYGDLCPKSIPAKLFAIIWLLVGLVIFSVFMSSLATLLTVTTVKLTIGSTSGTDTKTVAVVADSPEKRVALGSLSGKLTIGSTFPDLEQLVEALKTKRIDSLLVDMYTPVKRKDLFNGSWFEVAKLLEVEISHGVLLQGSSVKLADELSKMIITKNVQTEYLQDESEDKKNEEKNSAPEEPVTFFEPSSPYFVTTMHISLAAVSVLVCLGVLYHISCYKRTRSGGDNRIRQNSVTPDYPNARDAMETAVEEFYTSFSATFQDSRRKFKNELIQLAKMKQHGVKSTAIHNVNWESEA